MTDYELRSSLAREVELTSSNIKAYGSIAKDSVRNDLINKERFRLSKALLTLGRFDEAWRASVREDQRHLIMDLKAAMEKSDEETCDCKPDEINSQKGYIPVPTHFVAGKIFDSTVGMFRNIIKCSKCGHLNITEKISPVLQKVMKARADGISKHDSEVLK